MRNCIERGADELCGFLQYFTCTSTGSGMFHLKNTGVRDYILKSLDQIFISTGNICRSPIAEAVFRKLVTEGNIENKVSFILAAKAAILLA